MPTSSHHTAPFRTDPLGTGLADSLRSLRTSGDEMAWARFIGLAGPMVRRVCRSELPGSLWVEDAIQETLCAIQRDVAGWRGLSENEAAAWISAVARNVARQIQRRELRGQRRALALSRQDRVEQDPGTTQGGDWIEAVAQAVRTLPQRQQDVIKAVFFEGHSHREAAAKLGITAEYSSNLLCRAMIALRERLGTHAPALAFWALLVALPERPLPGATPGVAAASMPRAGAAPVWATPAGWMAFAGMVLLGGIGLAVWLRPATPETRDFAPVRSAAAPVAAGHVLVDGDVVVHRTGLGQPLPFSWLRPTGAPDPWFLRAGMRLDDRSCWTVEGALPSASEAGKLSVASGGSGAAAEGALARWTLGRPIDLTSTQVRLSMRVRGRDPVNGGKVFLGFDGLAANQAGRVSLGFDLRPERLPSSAARPLESKAPISGEAEHMLLYASRHGLCFGLGDHLLTMDFPSIVDVSRLHPSLAVHGPIGNAVGSKVEIEAVRLEVWPDPPDGKAPAR